MKKIELFFCSLGLWITLGACGNDGEVTKKDLEKPTITTEGVVAEPLNCSQYLQGDTIRLCYVLKDNIELGSYNVEIHNNFDHHSHSTDAGECELDAKKEANNHVWIYNKDFKIPAGSTTFVADERIPIPEHAQAGDYHFMIRFTDKAGHQEIKAVSIKIIEKKD